MGDTWWSQDKVDDGWWMVYRPLLMNVGSPRRSLTVFDPNGWWRIADSPREPTDRDFWLLPRCWELICNG